MSGKLRMARAIGLGSVLLLSMVLLTGCEAFSSPQNTFNPAGEVAEGQKNDFLLVMWPALFIMLLVLFGIVFIAIKFRHKKGDALPKQIHGNTALELTWTIIPIILLAVIAVPTVQGIRELSDVPDDALQVKVTGQRFSWFFEYPEIEAAGAPLAAPANELRIPVGQDIAIEIHSIDVNHSFWVPKLAGKTDAINNHVNHMWIRADETGEFSGQCAEFCGLQHSNMRMKVIVMPQDEFDAWVSQQVARQTGGEPLVSNGE
jgi:cytochrome c oxidase subunit 2